MPIGGEDMAGFGRGRKRHSLYVKQNKAYQLLLAFLVIAFILISAAVIDTTLFSPPSAVWRDNILIRMIIERRESD
jgi:hypothetical protein